MDTDSTSDPISGLHLQGISVASNALRLSIPPAHVQDVQKLLALEAHGFVPRKRIGYDPDDQAFVLELDGDAVSHLLELLSIAMDTRGAETWEERRAREWFQLPLTFADPVGDFICSVKRDGAAT